MKKSTLTVLLSALLCTLPILFSCSTTQKLPDDVTASHLNHDLELLVVMGLNDIHGALAPMQMTSKEAPGVEPVKYERGGLAVLASHIGILRKQFGPNLVILDAGDEFQGSIESNLEEGAPMVGFFNTIGLHAAAVGNHEFDFGPVGPEGTTGDPLGALKARMSEAKYPYLAANIIDKSTGKMPPFPNTVPSTILTAGRLKVGVIGLSTLETPTTTRPEHVRALKFTDLKEATLRESKALRKKGADIVLVTAHVGLKCQLGRANPSAVFRRVNDPLGECEGEMADLLRELPAGTPGGTIDAVVAGHSHQVVHHWVNQFPVIQGGARGHHYNLVYLVYDHSQKKLLRERTRIEGPIPVCPEVFENQNDCDGNRPAPRDGRGSLVTAKLHGHSVGTDGLIETQFDPIFEKTAAEKKKVVGEAARPIHHTRTEESELGNLVSDALRTQTGADVALINPGGLRAPFEPGPITYEAVFRTLPFDNSVSLLTVTGKELKTILRVAQSGARGIFPVSGLTLKLLDLKLDPKAQDLNGDGRLEHWEATRLIEARLTNGEKIPEKIQDQKTYTLATVDFLVSGGDDMGWAMSQIPKDRIQMDAAGVVRDVVMRHMTQEIAKGGPLNSTSRPLVNPMKPRVKFVRPKRR